MRKYSNYVVVAGALAALAAPTAAMADAPNGTCNIASQGQRQRQPDRPRVIADQAERAVRLRPTRRDRTRPRAPGSRAAIVQGQLALDGQGSLAK